MAPVQRFRQLVKAGEKAFYDGDAEAYETATRVAAKILRDLAKADQLDAALSLEPEWYNRLVKKVEKEDHYHRCFSWHKDALWEAGRRANKRSPLAAVHSASDGVTKIAFVAHSGVLLGHTEVMLRVISDWREAGVQVNPYFVSLAGMQPELKTRLKQLKIPFAVAPKGLKPVAVTEWLREALLKTGISTAVWLSTPCWVPYVFGYGVAARQVIWSLKFHPVHLGPTVIHIGMTKQQGGKTVVNGSEWWAYAPPLSIERKANDPAVIEAVRARWPGKVLLGTLAREEKFNSMEFVSTVAEILLGRPDAHYIYTGKTAPEILERELKRLGLSERASYVGWVDTNLYAEALDVFLETFPFGCGITGMQALVAGTPVVSMWAEDTLPRFYSDEVGHDPLPWWRITRCVADYVRAANELIDRTDIKKTFCGIRELLTIDRLRSVRALELMTQDSL